MRKNGNAIAIYSRKSKFTGKGESVGNQVEMCKEYIRMHYGDAAAEEAVIFEDEGFSGGNLNRPSFKKMMQDAKQRKYKAIIVYRLDRISRNVSDFSGLIEELAQLNVAFISIKEQFDTGTPMGRAMMYIASVFSQLERETIAERIRDNMHELAKTGRWLGGTTPLGYTSESVSNVTMDGKTKKACKLKLVPEQAETVLTIYQLFLELDSLTKTEAELMRRGIKTQYGNYFSRYSLRRILTNPVYMIADDEARDFFIQAETDLYTEKEDFDGVHGMMAYNRTNQHKNGGKQDLPPDEWIVAVGQHPGIISGKTWVEVQSALKRNKDRGYRTPRKNEALLTGIMYCRCGSRMYPRLRTVLTEDGQRQFSYVCQMKERSKGTVCNCRNVNGNMMDNMVMNELKKLRENPTEFSRQMEEARRYYAANHDSYEQQLTELREQQRELDQKMNVLIDSLSEAAIPAVKTSIMKRIEKLGEEVSRIEQRILEVEGLSSQEALSAAEFQRLEQILGAFCSSVDTMSPQQRRTALRTLVKRVIWDGHQAHMMLFGSDGEIEYPDISYLYTDFEHQGVEEEDFEDFDENSEFMTDNVVFSENDRGYVGPEPYLCDDSE